MANIKKEFFAKKIDEAALEKTSKEIWEAYQKTLRMPPPSDLKKYFENMPPSEASILKSILKTLSDLEKSQDDSSKKIRGLTWALVGLTFLLVVLTIILILRG